MFKDREEAGRLLAERMASYRDAPETVILALPRGGVAVGCPMSVALHLPLDVFITRKLGAPGDQEYAIGAVAETGHVYLTRQARLVLRELSAPSGYAEQAARIQLQEIERRRLLYRKGAPLPPMTERTVILVDDGIATGATFFASLEALRKLGVRRLVAAVPVGPRDTLELVRSHVDELVALSTPEWFMAVGNHYVDFRQVEDEEVVRYLEAAEAALRSGRRPTPSP